MRLSVFLLSLEKCVLERSTRFGLENFAHGVRIQGVPERSILHYSPFIIYADLECLLEKINTCYNNPEESSTTEINKHTPSGYSLFTHC